MRSSRDRIAARVRMASLLGATAAGLVLCYPGVARAHHELRSRESNLRLEFKVHLVGNRMQLLVDGVGMGDWVSVLSHPTSGKVRVKWLGTLSHRGSAFSGQVSPWPPTEGIVIWYSGQGHSWATKALVFQRDESVVTGEMFAIRSGTSRQERWIKVPTLIGTSIVYSLAALSWLLFAWWALRKSSPS